MEAELARVEVRVNDARARRLVHTAGTRAAAERAKAELAARHANDAEREQQGTADEWLAAHRDATTKDERHRVVPDADVTDQTAPTVVDAHLSTPGAVGGPISAPMVVALEAAWAAIWEWHPEIPAAVIVLGAGSIGAAGGGLKLGHVAAMRWNDPRPDRPGRRYRPRGCGCRRCSSVVKDSRAARLSARDAVARGRTRARGCAGDQGHKQAGPLAYARFKALAEELGIEVTKDPRIGWSPTSIPAATRDLYDEVIAELGRALRLRACGGSLLPGPAYSAARSNLLPSGLAKVVKRIPFSLTSSMTVAPRPSSRSLSQARSAVVKSACTWLRSLGRSSAFWKTRNGFWLPAPMMMPGNSAGSVVRPRNSDQNADRDSGRCSQR